MNLSRQAWLRDEQWSMKPLIGITCDVEDLAGGRGRHRIKLGTAYTEAVSRAGGVPIVLAPDPSLIDDYLARCDGIVFSGGPDIDVSLLGGVNHEKAEVMSPVRQRFETALLDAVDRARATPVLGICLGMQWMGVQRCGHRALIQHLPDIVPTAEQHVKDNHHTVEPTKEWGASPLSGIAVSSESKGVASSHHQAIDTAAAGGLRVLAKSRDGVLEAFDDPARPFYVGVQWHPERTRDEPLGDGVFRALIAAARKK